MSLKYPVKHFSGEAELLSHGTIFSFEQSTITVKIDFQGLELRVVFSWVSFDEERSSLSINGSSGKTCENKDFMQFIVGFSTQGRGSGSASPHPILLGTVFGPEEEEPGNERGLFLLYSMEHMPGVNGKDFKLTYNLYLKKLTANEVENL